VRDAKSDANQAEIVAALRRAGASVQDLHRVGNDCPDLLVGFRGINFIIEIKTLGGKLTPGQALWHLKWNGSVSVAWSIEDTLGIIGVEFDA
jgi:hypothetical protein